MSYTKRRINTKALLTMALTAATVLSAGELLAAPTVTSGFDPSATLKGTAHYRNFSSSGGGNKEVRVGAYSSRTSGVPVLASPADGDVTWGTGKCVQFSYDPTTNPTAPTLTTKIAASATPCVFTTVITVTKTLAAPLGSATSPLNYLQIGVTKNGSTTSIALNNVSLGADALGNFAIATASAGTHQSKVTGIDITNGFTLSGRIVLTGISGGGDSGFIEISVGNVVPPDNEGPVTSNVNVTPMPVLLNGQATVTANVDDTNKGGSAIAYAEYSLNDAEYDGPYSPMSAQDGAYDGVVEDVTATFTGTQIGLNEVCVRGADVLTNVGDPECQNFLVTYKFDGFFSPIDNDILNVAKAGQAVPAKWRLTDANGVPILNAASFDGLFTYPISCENLEGTFDDVEEYAAGSSGLQNLGDGYWQFNWKTPKAYAGQCHAMYVRFDSGAISPVVKFKFK